MKITVAGEVLEWGEDDLWDYLAQYGVVEKGVHANGAYHLFMYLSKGGRGKPDPGPYVMASHLEEGRPEFDVMADIAGRQTHFRDVRDAVEGWLRLCGKGVRK